MALSLQCFDEGAFLVWRDAAKDCIFFHCFGDLLLRGKLRGIDVLAGIYDTGLLRDLGNSEGIVAGNDFDFNALFGKIAEGFWRRFANRVHECYERERRDFAG